MMQFKGIILIFIFVASAFGGQKIDEVKRDLLKSDPYYMENHKEEALVEKLESSPNEDIGIPKRVPDKFVSILILPYVDNSDGWHDASKIQHKYKNGTWIFGEHVDVAEQTDVNVESSEFSFFEAK